VATAVDALQALAGRHAIGTSTAAVLAAAHKRGIPSLRLTEEANLFQLGWGSRQKRLQATITGAHFFPDLLSGPFMVGIKIAFSISLLLYIGAALASWLGAAPRKVVSPDAVPAE